MAFFRKQTRISPDEELRKLQSELLALCEQHEGLAKELRQCEEHWEPWTKGMLERELAALRAEHESDDFPVSDAKAQENISTQISEVKHLLKYRDVLAANKTTLEGQIDNLRARCTPIVERIKGRTENA